MKKRTVKVLFWQMVKGSFFRRRTGFLLIALTVALGVSLASAMLSVMFDVGNKVNQELKAFGANILVSPKNTALLKDMYGVAKEDTGKEYLSEADVGKLKTIFWANNIVNFAPSLNLKVSLEDGTEVPFSGTWFSHELNLPTGESVNVGVRELKSWWQVTGDYPEGEDTILVGKKLAEKLKLKVGDTLTLKDVTSHPVKVSGILDAGDAGDEMLLGELSLAQKLGNLKGKVESIEVSAITTPENDLARKAAANPNALSPKEKEIWYCTAYVSSIAFQIEEAISNSAARPVRQIAESEGKILDKTELLMLLITILSLLSAALGVSNLVSANVMERSRELGLLKALGASNLAVSLLILAELFIAGIIGSIIGYFLGFGMAQIIGETVFGSAILANAFVPPIVGVLMVLVLLLGSLPAIRFILSLEPASVLHGR